MTVISTRPAATAPSDTAASKSACEPLTEAQRLVAIERRLLHLIQWVVFGGVILLTVGAGALSWAHLTHIAATNGHIAPRHLLFLFPTIVDGFMVLSSGVVVRHALTDEGLGWRTWYAGCLVAADRFLERVPQHPGFNPARHRAGMGASRHCAHAVHARHRAGASGAATPHIAQRRGLRPDRLVLLLPGAGDPGVDRRARHGAAVLPGQPARCGPAAAAPDMA